MTDLQEARDRLARLLERVDIHLYERELAEVEER